jgi:hypothetical protein
MSESFRQFDGVASIPETISTLELAFPPPLNPYLSFYPFVLHEISVLVELILGHLRYLLTDVPPQPNSPPDNVFHLDRQQAALKLEAGTESRLQLME